MQTIVSHVYVHGPVGTRPDDTQPTPMRPLDSVEAVEGMGLRQDPRYFRRIVDGPERKRQVSLIDEGTITRLEQRFGPVPRDCIKAQIILGGDVFLPDLVDHTITFDSGAAITIAKYREPCYAMDLITDGLRTAMTDGQQGALGRVVTSGLIAVGMGVKISPISTLPAAG